MAEDLQLLRRYAETRAEDAFAALVERHIGLVYAAAQRQLGGAAHRAEDVTQSVFIDLARHASALARRDDIVGWLYTSTHYAAAKLKRSEARRQRREQEAHRMHEMLSGNSGSSHADWQQVRLVLDDAMHELSERDRQAVLLRFFRGENFAEVGRRLGLSEDAARMRVERALDKLHALLAKRGITSTSGALGVALAQQAVVAAPAGLAAAVTGAAMSGGAAVVAGAGSLAANLSLMNASKITLSLAAAAALAVGLAVYQSSRASTTSSELAVASADRNELAAKLVALKRNVAQAEQQLHARAAALEQQRAAAVQSSPAAATAAQKDLQAKALQQLLANDPQLQQMWRDSARQWRLFSWAPLFQRLRLTPAEIEQTLAELQRRSDLKISSASGVGFPDALAADARFMESQRHPAERSLVDNIVQYAAPEGVVFTPQQTEQLFKTFVELRPPSIAPHDPSMPALQANLDWAQVITQASAYLEPAQISKLANRASRMSRDKILVAATQAAP